MKISWNWLSEMVDLGAVGTPEKLAEILTQRGLEVEEIHSASKGLEKVVTVQILKRDKHPDSDRLSLCSVTTGSGEPLEIVCGAQNMKAGDTVALAQIGANLPNGLKIEKSKIRGVVSNGMLCSEDELGLGKPGQKSEGILILPAGTQLGQPIAKILGLDDTILTFKLTANRADCLSHFGMARELAAAIGKTAKRPSSKAVAMPAIAPGAEGKLGKSAVSVALEAGDAVPQFYGCMIEGVKIGPSPEWLVKRLEAVGSRSINNVVDATNLVMLELGHPTHAYDADLIEGKKIIVRMAREGEKLPLLDETEVTLTGAEIVIADGKRAVGLAGVMGGGNSEVRPETRNVFLECAEFAPGLVRRASSKHVKKTEASHRFERGVDPEGLAPAISRLAQLVLELAGGKITGVTVAQQPSRSGKLARKAIALKPGWIANYLGMSVTDAEVETVLKGLGCEVAKGGQGFQVTTPSFRMDLNLPEDLAEEVARTVGYDRIPATLPAITSAPRPQLEDKFANQIGLLDRAKDTLRSQGLSETLNYGFTSKSWLDQFALSSSARVVNPLSEEHEWMVPSLIPGLLKNISDNWRHHFGSEEPGIRLFEIRPTYSVSGAVAAQGEMATNVVEKWKLSFLISGPKISQGLRADQGEVDFSDLKAVLERLFEELGARGVRMLPLSESRAGTTAGINGLFHPGKSVEILAGNQVAGVAGQLHPARAKALKAKAPVWLAEIDWEALIKLSRSPFEARSFKPWSEFPPMERDFALVVKSDVPADKISQLALKAGKPLAKVAKIFDVYRGSQVAQGMTSVAVRVIFYEDGRSLTENETEAASAKILESWKKELGAELRG